MIELLPRAQSNSDRFARAFSNLSSSAAQEIPQELMGRQERSQLGDLIGEDISNIRNPDFQKQILSSGLERKKQESAYEADKENYEIIKNALGEPFAKRWLASGQGERTYLTKAALEAKARGLDINEALGLEAGPQEVPSAFNKPTDSQQKPKYKLNTSGMTAKEVVDYRASLRKENQPIWKEAIDNLSEYKELDRDIDILDKINEKKNLPEGLELLLIDPETGAPYPRGTIIKSPNRDVQQWAKTIARQATRAQTAFPGRVTNFDLAQYMRQFPGLFNTYEGRKIILKQMKLSNKAHLLMSEAMDKVYAEYKLSGITPEDAFQLARLEVEDEIKDIDRQLIALADEGEGIASQGQPLSGRMIDVMGPDGQLFEVDESEIGQLPEGYRIK